MEINEDASGWSLDTPAQLLMVQTNTKPPAFSATPVLSMLRKLSAKAPPDCVSTKIQSSLYVFSSAAKAPINLLECDHCQLIYVGLCSSLVVLLYPHQVRLKAKFAEILCQKRAVEIQLTLHNI